CIKGTNDLKFFDNKKINELADDYKKNFRENKLCNSQFSASGNAGYLKSMVSLGMFSTQNFSGSFFEDSDKIDGNEIVKKYKVRNINCYSCHNGCKKELSELNESGKKRSFGLIEIESLASCVNNLLINDPESAMEIWELICDFGLDGTSLGNVISFAVEISEKGLIKKEEINGIDLKWGNADAIKELIRMIVYREGMGSLLAEGVKRASANIKDSEDSAMHVKGLELPCHEPRVKQMLGFAYAVSPIGPYYSIVEHDSDFDFEADQLYMDKISPLGLYERIESEELSEKKIRMFYLLQPAGFSMLDSLCCCIFAFSPVRYFNFHQLVEIVNAATGWESSLFELWKLGEKRINMHKLFASREGIKKEDDILPKRLFEPISYGPKKGSKLNYEDFKSARDLYYHLAGWSQEGIPTRAKLLELDLLEFL
ncbi:MAG: aldehyde ferredoxin oxidoreductase C-terminal domain-containing protein, partial [Candidatus Humimicrobiaceae bacterium]